jgi:hypothetical protein
MAQLELVPIDRAGVRPFPISARLRTQLVYFMSAPGTRGVPPLGEDEYWFAQEDIAGWLDEGVFYLVSPLDTAHQTEVELTEEQESLLHWLRTEQVQHVRLTGLSEGPRSP